MKKVVDKIKVGITHGDINSISYEVILKTLIDSRLYELCTPIVYGSPKIAGYHRKALNINNFSMHIIKRPEDANPKRANVINCCGDNVRVELGKSTESAGEASYSALEAAVADLKAGKIDVLVTAPINKYNIQSDVFTFPGHTEYLCKEFNPDGDNLMLMVSDILRVGVVTGHVPISEVPKLITEQSIYDKLKIMQSTLIEDFAIRKPIIAVLGLNPHAGDTGLIGTEDRDIIIPAINRARADGIMALGPYSADGFFGSENIDKFDVVLAMYHDQGLIPFKTLAFDKGVNYTAGLSIIRTSPAHGTAYKLAGENVASPNSFRNAVYLACDIYKNRIMHKEFNKNSINKNISNESNYVNPKNHNR